MSNVLVIRSCLLATAIAPRTGRLGDLKEENMLQNIIKNDT